MCPMSHLCEVKTCMIGPTAFGQAGQPYLRKYHQTIIVYPETHMMRHIRVDVHLHQTLPELEPLLPHCCDMLRFFHFNCLWKIKESVLPKYPASTVEMTKVFAAYHSGPVVRVPGRLLRSKKKWLYIHLKSSMAECEGGILQSNAYR